MADEDEFEGARSVERATRAELRALKISVRTNVLAATMVSLARQIDYARGAASAAMAAAQLRETRRVLLDEAAEHAAGDEIDDVNAQPASRRAETAVVDLPAERTKRGRTRKADS